MGGQIARACAIKGCPKSAGKRSRHCPMHRARIARHGSPDAISPYLIVPPGSSTMRRLVSGIASDDGCWIWGRQIASGTGYGVVSVGRRRRGAHVVMWETYHGLTLPPGLVVCHACDVRACINPDHLWLGDPAANALDMRVKGRQARGERHSQRILTEAQVRAIRKDTRPDRAVAADFGVSRRCIGNVRSRATWAWLPDEESW